MKISEIFKSIQGEGPYTGSPALFIRLAGCNLRCSWCDSKYAWKKGKEISWREILKKIIESKVERVVWTGGEPILQLKDIEKVIEKLQRSGYFIIHDIETNGTIKFNIHKFSNVIISPKQERIKKDLLNWFGDCYNTYFKFVVKNKNDFKFWNDFIMINGLKGLIKSKIYFMPEGTTNTELKRVSRWLVEECIKCNYNFSPRLHIWLWGNRRGV